MSPTDAKRLHAPSAKHLCRGGLGDGRASSRQGGWGAARPQARSPTVINNLYQHARHFSKTLDFACAVPTQNQGF